ncbi:hypothetical protein [Streptomyces humi]|uniref:hypothetical protein n=1 Tax=Streptomyces humi TaxID=1428620 RepID=UPI00142D27A9|nr:hypothetical protein [Streptomyces humi]
MPEDDHDPKGYRTDLNVWSRDGAAEAAVVTWIKHFDDLWFLAGRRTGAGPPRPDPLPA